VRGTTARWMTDLRHQRWEGMDCKLAAAEQERTGIPKLKIGFNKVFAITSK